MAYDKPELEHIWAEGGVVVEPSNTKKQLGWVAEVPPHQYENWVQRRQDQFIFHVNERGIPEWDGQTNYLGGGRSLVQGSNGSVYKSVAASGPGSVVQNPTTDTANTYWERAYPDNDDPRVVNAVPNSRQVNAGDGLSGGGNLTANRTLSVDSSVVRTSRSITAGTGLSGGGNLSANRTLSVNYGTTSGTAAQGNDSRIVNAVPNSRTISTGAGLSGGGNLSANRTLSADFASEEQAQELLISNKVISPLNLGQAMNAHVLGMGQTWQDMSAQRAAGITYTNTSGRPIQITATVASPPDGGEARMEIHVDGSLIALTRALPYGANDINDLVVWPVIPVGSTYRIVITGNLIRWWELR